MLKETPDLFSQVVHETELLPENQKILDEYRDVLTESAKKVYEYLMSGQEGTIHDMKADRSRLSDLKRLGFQFSFRMQGRFKVWYASEADKEHNRIVENSLKKSLQSLNTVKE